MFIWEAARTRRESSLKLCPFLIFELVARTGREKRGGEQEDRVPDRHLSRLPLPLLLTIITGLLICFERGIRWPSLSVFFSS